MSDRNESATSANETIATLRQRWERAHGFPPPEGLGRDLLARSVSWQEQASTSGGLAPAVRRELARLAGQLSRRGEIDIERHLSLKTGTRLVREWHGRTLQVTVIEDGFVFEDRRYASLTQIARDVTGTNWSGPRFFGLRQRSRTAKAGEGADVQSAS